MSSLYVIRHGKTALNKGSANSIDTIRGWLDVPLVGEGRAEAQKTGDALRHAGIQEIVCSDLGRAQETAQIIGGVLGIAQVHASSAYRPWNLGVFTGKPTKDVLPKVLQYVEHPSEPVPQGESFDSFKERVLSAMQPLMEQVRQGATLALVTHFRDTKLIEAWIAAGAKPDLSVDEDTFKRDDAPTGSFAVVELNDDGEWEYGEPPQPNEKGASAKKLRFSAEEKASIGQLASGLIQAGRASMGQVQEWWATCEKYHRNEFTGAYDYQDWQPAVVPLEMPYSQPRQDMLTAQVCTVIGKQDPYMLSDTAAPNSNIKFVQQKVCHKFWQRAGFETKIRQASLITTDTNLAWYRVAWDRPNRNAKPFSGLIWDVIHPKDCVLFPATAGGIPSARLVGHRFYRTIAEIKSLQRAGVYFKEIDPTATGGPEQHDVSGQIANSGATPGVTGPDPADRLVELWQVVWQWARSEDKDREWFVSTVCPATKTLYAHEAWPYSRTPYFDTAYIMEMQDLYWPGTSIARNLSPLQDICNRMWTALYNGIMMTIAAPIFGPALPEKDTRFSYFSIVPTDTQVQPWAPTVSFRPEGAAQALGQLDVLGDRTSRVSANSLGSQMERQTTATESSIIAAGVATGAEEYINNFGQCLGEIADYTMELLATHFADWESEARLLGASPEILLQPSNWEQNGKTPGNTPGAKLAGIAQISQFAGQFGPPTGIDIYELTTVMLQNSPFQGADGIQLPKEQVQAQAGGSPLGGPGGPVPAGAVGPRPGPAAGPQGPALVGQPGMAGPAGGPQGPIDPSVAAALAGLMGQPGMPAGGPPAPMGLQAPGSLEPSTAAALAQLLGGMNGGAHPA